MSDVGGSTGGPDDGAPVDDSAAENGADSDEPTPEVGGDKPGYTPSHVVTGAAGSLEIFAADDQAGPGVVPVDTARWVTLARQVLGAEGVLSTGNDIEMSLLFVDESAIAVLNERFMGKTGPTDVLSFPIDEQPIQTGRAPDTGGRGPADERDEEDTDDDEAPVLLGDVVICPAVAARNAPTRVGPLHGGSVDDEIALLVVHGILHLLGMDHHDDDEAEAMEARERDLLGRFHKVVPA